MKEFFALRAPTILTDKWDKELFAKLSKEYGELTGSTKLHRIAWSFELEKHSLEERLAAFDKYNEITGAEFDDPLVMDLRALIMAERYKGTK